MSANVWPRWFKRLNGEVIRFDAIKGNGTWVFKLDGNYPRTSAFMTYRSTMRREGYEEITRAEAETIIEKGKSK